MHPAVETFWQAFGVVWGAAAGGVTVFLFLIGLDRLSRWIEQEWKYRNGRGRDT